MQKAAHCICRKHALFWRQRTLIILYEVKTHTKIWKMAMRVLLWKDGLLHTDESFAMQVLNVGSASFGIL